MDGEEGEAHPYWACRKMVQWGWAAEAECSLFHSRFLAKTRGVLPSKLCYADKLGNALMKPWYYAMVGSFTGEISEFIAVTKHEGTSDCKNPKEFFIKYRGVARTILKNSHIPEVKKYAEEEWNLPHISYDGKLNA